MNSYSPNDHMVIDEWWPFSGIVQNDSISYTTQESRNQGNNKAAACRTETRRQNDVKENFRVTTRQTNEGGCEL